MAPRNAITTRIDRLREQWTAFAEDEALRVLHWVIETEEWRVLDTFFTLESLEHASTEDAFVVVDAPFEGAGHGFVLRAWLVEQYERIRPRLEDAGVIADWAPPPVRAGTSDVVALCDAAQSLWEHHQPLFRHLALALVPTAIHDTSAWVAWSDRLVAACEHANVRFILVDHRASAPLSPVAAKHAAKVKTVVADLDMPSAYVELSIEAGNLDKPSGLFRHAFVLMSNAFGSGDVATAEAEAERAKRVASAQQWTHLLFAVDFARGSGHLARGDVATSIQCYREAERAAEQAENGEEDWGTNLRLKARLGQAAACVAAAAYPRAAEIYESCVPLAQSVGDRRMLLDCYRMASYCHEQARNVDRAWTHGMDAVAVGKTMDEEERRTSTLAHAGEALLRLCKHRKYAGGDRAVEQVMRSLLGQQWRALTQPARTPAA